MSTKDDDLLKAYELAGRCSAYFANERTVQLLTVRALWDKDLQATNTE